LGSRTGVTEVLNHLCGRDRKRGKQLRQKPKADPQDVRQRIVVVNRLGCRRNDVLPELTVIVVWLRYGEREGVGARHLHLRSLPPDVPRIPIDDAEYTAAQSAGPLIGHPVQGRLRILHIRDEFNEITRFDAFGNGINRRDSRRRVDHGRWWDDNHWWRRNGVLRPTGHAQ
jgi:hypothetical protein